jgi:hypothetical protein
MKKVRWTKENKYSTAYVEVYENGTWVNYRHSTIYTKDLFSDGAGFKTFTKAISLGYSSDGLYIKAR